MKGKGNEVRGSGKGQVESRWFTYETTSKPSSTLSKVCQSKLIRDKECLGVFSMRL
jgi:hypothetical protein